MKRAAKKATKSKVKKVAKASTKTALQPEALGVKVGFELEATGGLVTSKDLLGRKYILYFYPKDSTPGCTQEGHDFSSLSGEFKKLGYEIFGVSRDSVKSHENFKAKQGYKFHLISDSDEKLCRLLGVMRPKKLYGREYIGVDRSTFVIDESGKVQKEWRTVKVAGHAQEVLDFVKSL